MGNDFSFNEEDAGSGSRRKPTGSGFSKILISWGLAKTPEQASMYLVGLVAICFMLIIYINLQTFGSAPAEAISSGL
jgi:hypothetical protein